MALSGLCCFASLPSLIDTRTFLPISPIPVVLFHRAHSSKSPRICASPTRDLHGFTRLISHVFAVTDASSTEEKNPPPSSRIFIKGLSSTTSEGYLVKVFSQFGEISKVKIVTSRGSKESLGMAYIWFASEESSHLATKEMNGKFVDGRFIAVMISRPEAPTKHVKFMPYRFN